jgi:hypothetical protein
MNAFGIGAAATLFAVAVAPAAAASADPAPFDNGFGNAQDTVNALRANGYNVVLSGAAVNPLSSCKVTGVEGLNDSNATATGTRIDATRFDTVYVDIVCRDG